MKNIFIIIFLSIGFFGCMASKNISKKSLPVSILKNESLKTESKKLPPVSILKNENLKTESKKLPLVSILKNGNFKNELESWGFWGNAESYSNKISVLVSNGKHGKYNFLRIENPQKNLIGLQQLAKVSSGSVYRISGSARSTVTNDSNIIFGGRIGFYLPPQKEKQIVWTSEFNNWWRKELIFTNTVDGFATIYIHMGYGNVSSTGEFAGITLEKIGN